MQKESVLIRIPNLATSKSLRSSLTYSTANHQRSKADINAKLSTITLPCFAKVLPHSCCNRPKNQKNQMLQRLLSVYF